MYDLILRFHILRSIYSYHNYKNECTIFKISCPDPARFANLESRSRSRDCKPILVISDLSYAFEKSRFKRRLPINSIPGQCFSKYWSFKIKLNEKCAIYGLELLNFFIFSCNLPSILLRFEFEKITKMFFTAQFLTCRICVRPCHQAHLRVI